MNRSPHHAYLWLGEKETLREQMSFPKLDGPLFSGAQIIIFVISIFVDDQELFQRERFNF